MLFDLLIPVTMKVQINCHFVAAAVMRYRALIAVIEKWGYILPVVPFICAVYVFV